MSLLSSIQQVSAEVGIAIPRQVIGSADTTVIQALALAQREGKELACRYDWAALQKETTITLVAGQVSYALPVDFDRLINRTEWDRSNHWELLGPMSPQEWQWRQSGVAVSSPRRRFRIKGTGATTFFITPTPATGDAGQILAFEYNSSYWCQSAGGAGQTAWALDTDTGILSEDLMQMGLIWRFKAAKGLAYDEQFREYQYACDRESAQEAGAPSLSLTRRGLASIGITPAAVPETGFGP